MTYCGNDCCKECNRLAECGGCEACRDILLEGAVLQREVETLPD